MPPAPNAFIQTRSLAFDSAGNLWVADQGHHRIDIFYASNGLNLDAAPQKKITPPGGVTTTFDMRGLAIDPTTGMAFVANGQNCLVQSFNANPSSSSYGAFVTNFNGVGSGSDCGSGPGQFEDGARDIAVDGNGNVWVGDLGDFRAEVFNQSGVYQSSVPNPPAPPPNGGFDGPRGVAFDSAGDMYVSDTYNERIEEFTPSGERRLQLRPGLGDAGRDRRHLQLPASHLHRSLHWRPGGRQHGLEHGGGVERRSRHPEGRLVVHRRGARRSVRSGLRARWNRVCGQQQRQGRGRLQQLGR